ncbi:hypothetical protein TNCV_4988491 [Trichonephila clavipes]|nr:hypothetical protein TNCV_4988491 [Trichonephila clavipes]
MRFVMIPTQDEDCSQSGRELSILPLFWTSLEISSVVNRAPIEERFRAENNFTPVDEILDRLHLTPLKRTWSVCNNGKQSAQSSLCLQESFAK